MPFPLRLIAMMAKTFLEDTEASALSFEYLWARRVTMEYTFGSFASRTPRLPPPYSLLSLPWLAGEKVIEVLSQPCCSSSDYGQLTEGALFYLSSELQVAGPPPPLPLPPFPCVPLLLTTHICSARPMPSPPPCRTGSTAVAPSPTAASQQPVRQVTVDEVVRQLERDLASDKLAVVANDIRDEIVELRTETSRKLGLLLEHAGIALDAPSPSRNSRGQRVAGLRSRRSGEAEAPPRNTAPPRKSIDGFLSAVSKVETAPPREHLAA